jgi:hypothetical protein
LKAKQSLRNLRQTSVTLNHDAGDGEEYKPLQQLQQQQEGNNNASRSPASVSATATATATTGEWMYEGAENIPPVPPVPKELLQSANANSKEAKKGGIKTGKDSKRNPSREFAWPEDIF